MTSTAPPNETPPRGTNTTFTGIAHLAIVVRDMATSVDWYSSVLGFERVGDIRPGPPEAGHPRQLMQHEASGLVLAVHEPERRSNDLFDPSRTGLDHISVTVPVAQLSSWADHFERIGVEHSGVQNLGHAQMVTFNDPDRIAWELWAPGD